MLVWALVRDADGGVWVSEEVAASSAQEDTEVVCCWFSPQPDVRELAVGGRSLLAAIHESSVILPKG